MEADASQVKKIFIQRDYSYGTGVRFSTLFPPELTGKVGLSSWGKGYLYILFT